MAGSLSDIFGRRNVILAGEFISLIGAVMKFHNSFSRILADGSVRQIIAAVTKNISTLIAGSTLLGLSCGFVLVSYAAVPELLPNKYR